MDIPIPIPIGVRNIASVQGTVLKLVACEHCQQQFAYHLELEGIGQDINLLFLDGQDSSDRTLAKAKQNLLLKGHNIIVPIPCPTCGKYQQEMVRQLKQEDRMNAYQIVGAFTAIASYAFLLLSMQHAWLLTLAFNILGTALVAYGYHVASQWDPNDCNLEDAKSIGRRNTIWGERLTKLIATDPEIIR